MREDLLAAALDYAKRGWYVVPDHTVTIHGACSCNDPACKTPGKHPRMERGSIDEKWRGTGSISEIQIQKWWTEWPDSNIAIVCGAPSNLIAIDIDPRNNGFDSLSALERRYGKLPPTVRSITGGMGRHILFTHPKREEVRNRIGLYPGIDVKADKGRIVAPPSRHKSGLNYKWEPGSMPFQVEVAPIPRWLLNLIQTQKGTGTWQAMKKSGLKK